MQALLLGSRLRRLSMTETLRVWSLGGVVLDISIKKGEVEWKRKKDLNG